MTQKVRAAILFVFAALLVMPLTLHGQTADEIRKQIDSNNTQIAQLNQDIAQYQEQLTTVSAKKTTLQNTLTQLDLSQKKIGASIKVIQSSISTTQLEIQQLTSSINDTQASVDRGTASLAESIRRLDEVEKLPLAVQLLAADSLNSAWQDIDATQILEGAIHDQIIALGKEKKSLADTKTATEQKKAQLMDQRNALLVQQGSLAATQKAQTELLTQTKAQESNYQKILAQKQAAKASFEQALTDLQTKLQYVVNPSQITPAGKGVLHWPLDSVRITQYFGNTEFAQSGGYNGKGHNGIDLAAQIGTPVKAALMGTVIGTGNTDAVRGCYSFGKWVLIKHGNGLDSLYAHLSQISVAQGDVVSTGEVVGFSGETGYATGPHLHFGVYVSSATQIIKLADATRSATPCANAVMPVAPLSGYLNPLDYL